MIGFCRYPTNPELAYMSRTEVISRGMKLQSEGILEVLALTDVNFRLHEDVSKLLGANGRQFLVAYFE